jgi:uncharacterized membrane protein YesL
MNWFAHFYFAEGPGIPKDASKAAGLRLLGRIVMREWWELIKLNLLFAALALPLVTLPAAYVAMTGITATMVEDRHHYLWRDFRDTFMARFWTAGLAGAILSALETLAVLSCAAYARSVPEYLILTVPMMVTAVVAVLILIFAAHLFVLLAVERDVRLGICVRAAAIGVLLRPFPALGALSVIAALWLAHILFYPASVFLPMAVNFAFGALFLTFAVREGAKRGLAMVQSSAQARRSRIMRPDKPVAQF